MPIDPLNSTGRDPSNPLGAMPRLAATALGAALLAMAVAGAFSGPSHSTAQAPVIPPTTLSKETTATMSQAPAAAFVPNIPGAALPVDGKPEVAVFAAGCFWGVEATFRKTPGVLRTDVGYTGGHQDQPTYKQVCGDNTGHAEAVRVLFDPAKVSYDQLLNIFWENHDPTQVNRQGPDFGTQYRTAIFASTPEQEAQAKASKDALGKSGKFSRPIATQVVPAVQFWPAEDYHQQYLEKRGLASCHM